MSDAYYNCSPPMLSQSPGSNSCPMANSSVYVLSRSGISLWPVQVSSPGSTPSQLLVLLLAGRARETEKSLT